MKKIIHVIIAISSPGGMAELSKALATSFLTIITRMIDLTSLKHVTLP